MLFYLGHKFIAKLVTLSTSCSLQSMVFSSLIHSSPHHPIFLVGRSSAKGVGAKVMDITPGLAPKCPHVPSSLLFSGMKLTRERPQNPKVERAAILSLNDWQSATPLNSLPAQYCYVSQK